MASIKKQLLSYLQQPGYEPVKLRELARQLGVKKKHRQHFEELIESLILRGKVRLDQGLVVATATQSRTGPQPGLIAGILKGTLHGGAWLIPDRIADEHSEPSFAQAQQVEDVFVYPEDLGDAQSGDQVLVRLIGKRRSGGRRCGRVEQVVERATHTFVGTYFEDFGQGLVKVDGRAIAEPVHVGDPGALGAVNGDKVVIEMVRFPSPHQAGEAVLTRVLGPRGEPGIDELAIIAEYGLPTEFPADVLDAARKQAERFAAATLEDRVDLTKDTIITIDPADARDFDDAISLSRSDDGHWHLGVHIADVAHFVPPGSALDREAFQRGTSVYLPGRVIPMLPEIISNALASLQKGHVRFTTSVFMEFSTDGMLLHTDLQKTAINVARRFAYEEVMPIVRDPDAFHGKVSIKVRELLGMMHELAMTLRRRRFEAGALELHLPEVKVELDRDGRVSHARLLEHDESHQIIEEFMLAANCAVAQTLADQDIAFLRRVHASPDPVKLQAFGKFVESLGLRIGNVSSRFEMQVLVNSTRGKPFEQAVNFTLLRSMKQAEYTGSDIGHYALAVDHYCHFTSPIRRYPDLTVHRLVDDVIAARRHEPASDGAVSNQKPARKIGQSPVEVTRLGVHCSTTERRAASAERDLIRVKLLMFLSDRADQEFDAIITGVQKSGVFCRCEQYPVDGFIGIAQLGQGDYLDFDRETSTITGRRTGCVFRMGDRMRVRVGAVDPDARSLTWDIVSHEGGRSRRRPVRDASGPGKRRTSGRSSEHRADESRSGFRDNRGRSRSSENDRASGSDRPRGRHRSKSEEQSGNGSSQSRQRKRRKRRDS